MIINTREGRVPGSFGNLDTQQPTSHTTPPPPGQPRPSPPGGGVTTWRGAGTLPLLLEGGEQEREGRG